jgi:hypothetical protein
VGNDETLGGGGGGREGGGGGKDPLTLPFPRIPAVIIYSATFSKDDRKDGFFSFVVYSFLRQTDGGK